MVGISHHWNWGTETKCRLCTWDLLPVCLPKFTPLLGAEVWSEIIASQSNMEFLPGFTSHRCPPRAAPLTCPQTGSYLWHKIPSHFPVGRIPRSLEAPTLNRDLASRLEWACEGAVLSHPETNSHGPKQRAVGFLKSLSSSLTWTITAASKLISLLCPAFYSPGLLFTG